MVSTGSERGSKPRVITRITPCFSVGVYVICFAYFPAWLVMTVVVWSLVHSVQLKMKHLPHPNQYKTNLFNLWMYALTVHTCVWSGKSMCILMMGN